MKNALIIHGAYGTPSQNWFPWLKNELEKHGYEVFVPQFPTPENQNLNSWIKIAEPYLNQMNHETVIIGHSIGATFSLRLLEKVHQPISIAALVAGFNLDLPDQHLNHINHTFYDQPFDWKSIRANARQICAYHSPNDPFVPLEIAEELVKQLHTSLQEIPDAGHFNSASGYARFPQLLQAILELNSN